MAYPPDWRVGDVPIMTTSRNTTRILMPGAIIFSGRRPAPAPAKRDVSHEAGGNSFGVVYANDLAREAMIADPSIPFPRGSIIIREKLRQQDAKIPELMTVMIKRRAGFNPKANDWEFLLIDGTGTKVLERQKKGSCLDCHESQASRDFVYPTLTKP
jgi:Cytochrome P460